MKPWSYNHPKAALMARKRAAILGAARAQFLESGYAGTSMESIAKSANVSIMTLYRHAETKDALFAAVIATACQPGNAEDQAELEKVLTLPLPDVLLHSALHIQEILTRGDTIALIRVVISEVGQFPHLAELAYQGFIVRPQDITAQVLSQIPETSTLHASARQELGRVFVDRIVGPPLLRVLLGLPVPDRSESQRRAELARDAVLDALRLSNGATY
ncbi:MAG: TetR/AcrR family transcriptional regulator [Pseudomonadota bacterium]|nr:TetR/AcrR family transcriptional regulator [Pseudomonadota bacterium]